MTSCEADLLTIVDYFSSNSKYLAYVAPTALLFVLDPLDMVI
jgi:hypothetical protein